jgi:AhpD family alkylhydroperoxidase
LISVAVTVRCDGCIAVHSEAAARHGASREEIAEALGVATAVNAGAALVYSSRVLDAYEQVTPHQLLDRQYHNLGIAIRLLSIWGSAIRIVELRSKSFKSCCNLEAPIAGGNMSMIPAKNFKCTPMRSADKSRRRNLDRMDLPFIGTLVPPRAQPRETILRVGSLELDLIDRTANRGDRPIALRPREFQLLRYMMQRSDQLLARATLFKEVWHYKFVPETNLVDVHMGRLRRKVDGPNEAPMIRNVRGAGFVLSATSLQGSPTRTAELTTNLECGAPH